VCSEALVGGGADVGGIEPRLTYAPIGFFPPVGDLMGVVEVVSIMFARRCFLWGWGVVNTQFEPKLPLVFSSARKNEGHLSPPSVVPFSRSSGQAPRAKLAGAYTAQSHKCSWWGYRSALSATTWHHEHNFLGDQVGSK
jgi:hypothetical protein